MDMKEVLPRKLICKASAYLNTVPAPRSAPEQGIISVVLIVGNLGTMLLSPFGA